MLINLSEILSNPNKVGQYECGIEMESYKFQGNEYPIVFKSPVTFTATNMGKKEILLKGEFLVRLLIPCGRCLTDVLQEFAVKIDKLIDFKVTDQQRMSELDETSFIVGTNLDVDKFVYDELLLSIPTKVLCKEDCKGICFVCGADLNTSPCNCDRTVLDPRMSVIRDIFKNFKEV